MRHILFLGAAAMLLAAPHVRADAGPRPGGPGQQFQAPKFKINIEVDEKATEPRLLVPIQVMFGGGLGLGGGFGLGGGAGLQGNFGIGGGVGGPPANFGNLGHQGGAPPAPKPRPGGQDEEPAADPAQESQRQSSLPLSTMIIGLALTLSLSTGGLWVARQKGGAFGSSRPLGLFVAILSIALLSGAAAWANFAPAPGSRPVRPQPQPQPVVPGPLPALLKMEGVKVELLQRGDTVRLILTKKHKEQLKGK